MNCDTAFDLLTDAETSRSSALARHFESCPRCRQMQETLAPALGFLARHDHNDSSQEFSATLVAEAHRGGRQPMITVEALKIAEQAARGLAAQGATRRDRLQRQASSRLRYAAVFAAGLILAVTLMKARDTVMPIDKQCTRTEAARNDLERSAAEIRALAMSCSACHDASQSVIERSATSNESGRIGAFDWVRHLLEDETLLIAASEHPVSIRQV